MGDRWPTLFVAGPSRCGTTSLHRYLDQHPGIFMSPVKETYFFDQTLDEVEDDPDRLAGAEAEYLSLFEDADDDQVLGEATPSYVHRPEVPGRIRDRAPEARFVVSLRDPVERIQSEYMTGLRTRSEDRTFGEFVDDLLAADEAGTQRSIQAGRYHTNLRHYLDVFDRDRLLVVLFEDLKRDAVEMLSAVADHVGVDPAPMADVDTGTAHNPSGVPRNRLAGFLRNDERVRSLARRVLPKGVREYVGDRVLLKRVDKPEADEATLGRLVDVYADEIDALEELLGRDLPELRRTWPD